MSEKGYNGICRLCLESREARIKRAGERVVGGQCWECTAEDTEYNPIYRLGPGQ